MKIGVIGDTHGSVTAWREALAGPLAGVDFLLHAGDFLYHGPRNPLPAGYDTQELARLINDSPVPILAARGNCDADIDQVLVGWPLLTLYAVAQFDGVRIVVSHGHLEDKEERFALARRYRATIWISGHTHVAALSGRDGILFLNPGSVALPKGQPPDKAEAPEPTVAIIEPAERRATIVTLAGRVFATGRF